MRDVSNEWLISCSHTHTKKDSGCKTAHDDSTSLERQDVVEGHERRVSLPGNASVEKFFVDERSVIASSAGEAEFYAFVKGSCVAVRAMRHHDGSGTTYLLKIRTESSAEKGISTRRGARKVRSTQAPYAWVHLQIHAN